jgi:hypothetical protein
LAPGPLRTRGLWDIFYFSSFPIADGHGGQQRVTKQPSAGGSGLTVAERPDDAGHDASMLVGRQPFNVSAGRAYGRPFISPDPALPEGRTCGMDAPH